ncbi:DUF2269 family protein [Oceanobacillus piezotolerans]|uniref:DUF2269 family protein n=1 Tax=Oceanobacillus piezotolerans TaxID=2448030 RepID=A0A498D2V7_9BACI|nr:DUF2269 family protein [Oceanobacillus piezotolerans]RLL42052.1 DUF2269 family protein [Oceanobacillus piezotolerans]
MTFYNLLVFIHIFAAIIGMGPGLVMTLVVTAAKPSNMTELKHAFRIRNTLHILTMIGGTLLLITGIWMGLLNPYWFTQGWYITSLVLFLIALAFGPLLLKPRSQPIKQLFRDYTGEEIPKEYDSLSQKLFYAEHIENMIFLIIIALMIIKPL